MNTPTWVIENLTKEQSYLDLSAAAKELGYPVLDLRGDYSRSILNNIRTHPVIFAGTIEMTKLIMPQLEENGHFVLAANNWTRYLCSTFYPKLGKYLFNDDYVFIPLIELARRKYFFYGLFGKEATIFVRPDSGDKTFKGGPLFLEDFDKFIDQFESEKDALVVVSSPKNIMGEWRFVVDSTKILAQSSYRYQGLHTLIPSAPKGATELCNMILQEGYHPEPVYCIDIAEDSDGNFWLLELTSFASAGLYACDKKKVVQGVSDKLMEIYKSHEP